MSKTIGNGKLQFDPYDIFILAITGLSLFSLIILAVPYFDSAAQQIALSLDLVLSFLFMLDFFYSLYSTNNKQEYLKWGWLDFLGSLPYLPFLRVLRIFRAIRSIRIIRQNNLQEIRRDLKNRLERTTFFSVLLFCILLVSLSSYAILQTEKLSPSANIKNAGDALWWAVVTVTTVGYGDIFPTTNGGRIIAIVLMLLGIGFFSVLTSYLSTLFINRGSKIDREQNEELLHRISAIEQQLNDLNEEIKGRTDN